MGTAPGDGGTGGLASSPPALSAAVNMFRASGLTLDSDAWKMLVDKVMSARFGTSAPPTDANLEEIEFSIWEEGINQGRHSGQFKPGDPITKEIYRFMNMVKVI